MFISRHCKQPQASPCSSPQQQKCRTSTPPHPWRSKPSACAPCTLAHQVGPHVAGLVVQAEEGGQVLAKAARRAVPAAAHGAGGRQRSAASLSSAVQVAVDSASNVAMRQWKGVSDEAVGCERVTQVGSGRLGLRQAARTSRGCVGLGSAPAPAPGAGRSGPAAGQGGGGARHPPSLPPPLRERWRQERRRRRRQQPGRALRPLRRRPGPARRLYGAGRPSSVRRRASTAGLSDWALLGALGRSDRVP